MKAACLVALIVLLSSGLFVWATTPTPPPNTTPFRSFAAPDTATVWWVGASSTDSSALPNAGVQGVIQVISTSVSASNCLAFWVSDDLSNNYWGQVGYYICGSTDPIAFYQIWNLNNMSVLSGGTTSVSTGNHTFSMYLQSGTTWAYTLDGAVFGTYNMGATSSSSSYPVYALSEEQADSVFSFPTVTFSTAMQVLKSRTWSPVLTAESYGTAWGVVGVSQNVELADNQIMIGGSLATLPAGTGLWRPGSTSTTSSTASTSSSVTLPPVTTTTTATSTATQTLASTQTVTLTGSTSTTTVTVATTSTATRPADTSTITVTVTSISTATQSATATVTQTQTSHTVTSTTASTTTSTVTETITQTATATTTLPSSASTTTDTIIHTTAATQPVTTTVTQTQSSPPTVTSTSTTTSTANRTIYSTVTSTAVSTTTATTTLVGAATTAFVTETTIVTGPIVTSVVAQPADGSALGSATNNAAADCGSESSPCQERDAPLASLASSSAGSALIISGVGIGVAVMATRKVLLAHHRRDDVSQLQ